MYKNITHTSRASIHKNIFGEKEAREDLVQRRAYALKELGLKPSNDTLLSFSFDPKRIT